MKEDVMIEVADRLLIVINEIAREQGVSASEVIKTAKQFLKDAQALSKARKEKAHGRSD